MVAWQKLPSEAIPRSANGEIVRGVAPVFPLVLMMATSAGIVGPDLNYMRLNFFARDHTTLSPDEVRCDIHPDAAYCRQAVLDDMRWTVALGAISSAVQVLCGPLLGALSDVYGRRPVVVACTVLGWAPNFAQALFVYCGTSLYVSFALSPLGDLPVMSVFFAYISDLVPNASLRVVVFALVMATGMCSSFVGLFIGAMLTMTSGFTISLCLSTAAFLYTVCFLPESLPEPKRTRGLDCQVMMPLGGLTILGRNQLFLRLTFILITSSFCNVGFEQVKNSYLQKYFPWTLCANYLSAIVGLASSLIWLAFGLRSLSQRVGEVGVLIVSQVASAVYSLSLGCASEVWQVWVLNFIFLGPMSISFPAISALKSRLVDDGEQGRLQGALGTAKAVAEGLGPIFFGYVFQSSNRSPEWTPLSGLVFLSAFALSLPSLAVLLALPKWLELHHFPVAQESGLKAALAENGAQH